LNHRVVVVERECITTTHCATLLLLNEQVFVEAGNRGINALQENVAVGLFEFELYVRSFVDEVEQSVEDLKTGEFLEIWQCFGTEQTCRCELLAKIFILLFDKLFFLFMRFLK
jgi:hypothetical protein